MHSQYTVTAEFPEEPLRVDEFTWRVTKASIDLTIDCRWICPKAKAVTFHCSLEQVQAEVKIQHPA